MSENLLDHVNCKILGFPNELKVIAKCNDQATFERICVSYNSQFKNVTTNPEEREVIVNCATKDDYELVLAVIQVAKQFLMMTEPEKMGVK